jgi:pimeloyl-ACP methyl ester carboxylesterase
MPGSSRAGIHTYAGKFSGRYSHRTIEGGIGHNLPQEAPEAFADAVLEAGTSS